MHRWRDSNDLKRWATAQTDRATGRVNDVTLACQFGTRHDRSPERPLVLVKQSLLGEDFSSSDLETSLLVLSFLMNYYLMRCRTRQPAHTMLLSSCAEYTCCVPAATFRQHVMVHHIVLTNTPQHGSFEDSATSIYKQSRVQNCSLKQIQSVVLIGDRFSLSASLQHHEPGNGEP